ncbi:MAG: hypothetical protein ACFB0G_20015 [Leptolyngbyaceae cyanobacterium]
MPRCGMLATPTLLPAIAALVTGKAGGEGRYLIVREGLPKVPLLV